MKFENLVLFNILAYYGLFQQIYWQTEALEAAEGRKKQARWKVCVDTNSYIVHLLSLSNFFFNFYLFVSLMFVVCFRVLRDSEKVLLT